MSPHLRRPALAYKGPAAVFALALLACVGWCVAAAGGSTRGARGDSGGDAAAARPDASTAASAAVTVTNTNDNGPGSLRAAIASAAAGETINFAPGLSGVITLTTGELFVNKDLTISGPGARLLTVSGNHSSRVFLIQSGATSISGLTISNGRTSNAGGGISSAGSLTMDACVVSNNLADSSNGGGIFFSGATLVVRNSTVSGNTAPNGSGGGMAVTGDSADIVNSTISGNSSMVGGFGGGISQFGSGPLNITASTVTDNDSIFGGGIHVGSALNLRSSVVAGNSANIGPDIEGGTVNSQGFNLVGNSAGANIVPATGDKIGTSSSPLDARLGPLANNGGPTDTHALLDGSPAIDAGDDRLTGPPFNLSTDQRGRPRRVGSRVDIGAYELQNNFVVTNTGDGPEVGSLRRAIIDANARPNVVGVPDTITFNIPRSDPNCAPLSGVCTIRPASALPAITEAVVIDGYTQPGARPNTLAVGDDAVLLVELDGSLAGVGPNGLRLLGGGSTVAGLVINRFSGANFTQGNGVVLQSDGNTVVGCFIGTDAGGASGLGNSASGVFLNGASGNVVGGALPASRNVISGNGNNGLDLLNSRNNSVLGNYIGTSRDGNSPLGNTQRGVLLNSSPDNTVGGAAAGGRNVISANNGEGVYSRGVASSGNVVAGNYVGTNAAGSAALGNGRGGVLIDSPNCFVGGVSPGSGNLISGNDGDGITVETAAATGNVVRGNLVGTDFTGAAPLGNTGAGVNIQSSASDNAVGGAGGTEGNLIAFNGGDGVSVQSGARNRVLRNSIFSNAGLGLDLGASGVGANDALDFDGGANNQQNFPVLTSVRRDGSNFVVGGSLNSAPNGTFRIQFFANTTCDTSGNGEGQTFIGELLVTTNSGGNAAFTSLLPSGVGAAQFVTATATDISPFDPDPAEEGPPVPRNDTSEFSPCAAPIDPSADITTVVTNTNDAGAGSLREAVIRVNAAGGGRINFEPGLGGTITLSGVEIEIRAARSVTIQGPGSDRLTVSANKTSRVFNVREGDVKISGLTIANGRAAQSGGGIRNDARLLLADCKVSTNETVSINLSPSAGGGIFNGGTLTVNNCEVSNNRADRGAGVYNAAKLNVTGSDFSLNRAEGGGGGLLNAPSATAVIESSTVSRNGASGDGGAGILNLNDGPAVSLTVSSTSLFSNVGVVGGGIHNKGRAEVFASNVSRNAASNGGGGILNAAGATLGLTNSTVSGNNTISGVAEAGGAGVSNRGTLNLTSCTVTRNNGLSPGGGVFNTGTANVRSSIIAGNTFSAHPDVSGRFNSQGSNLVGKKDGSTGFEDGVNADQAGTIAAPLDPRLGPLQPNGGPTDTHALLDGSPAIDAGDDRLTGPPFNLSTDQRGRPRPGRARVVGGSPVRDRVDIGAYETSFVVSGVVFNQAIRKGLAGVTISLLANNSVLRTTETDASGNFVFRDVPEGSNFVLLAQFLGGAFDPEKQKFSGIKFTPETLGVAQVGGEAGDVTGLRFDWSFLNDPVIAGINVLVKVSGDGPPVFIGGATVTLSGPKSEVTETSGNGECRFENIPRGGDYIITPTHPDFTFEPVNCGLDNAGAKQGGGCELSNLQAGVSLIFEGEPVAPPPPALDDNFRDTSVIKEHFNLGILSLDPCDSSGAVSVAQGGGRLTITPPAGVPQSEPCQDSTPTATTNAAVGGAAAATGAFNGYVAVRDVDLNSITNVSVEAIKTLEGRGAHTIFSVGRDNENFFRIRVGQETLEAAAARRASGSRRHGAAAATMDGPTIFFETNDSKFSHSAPFNGEEDVFWRLRFEPVRDFVSLPAACKESGIPQDTRRVVMYETSRDRVSWRPRHCAPIDRTRTQVASELLAGIVGDANRNPGTATFGAYKVAEQTRIGFRLEGLSHNVDPNVKEQDVRIEVERKGATDSSALVSYEFDDASGLKKGIHFEDITGGAGRVSFEPGKATATRPITLRLRVDRLGANDRKLKLRLKDDPQDAEDDVAGGVIDDSLDEAVVEIGAGNPIERPRFFVTQNYIDFLGRGPDDRGLDFWASAIESCGGDQSCVNAARVNVSAAFFLSIEFQETGFSAYLANKAAYGDIPGKPVPVTMCQLQSELREIKGDVRVGVGDWAAQLEANKAEYYRRFVETERFREKYERLGSPEYVASLFANAGLSPSLEESAALALGLLTRTETRATVLRKVSERAELKRGEFNKAFVLMQYFGYMRRNPDEGRDTNFGGFNFWLRKLDEHGGDYNAAQMVFAFLDSDEYKSRFLKDRGDPCGGP